MFLNRRHRLARHQRDPAERAVIEFQRVTGLLDVPVADPGLVPLPYSQPPAIPCYATDCYHNCLTAKAAVAA